MTGPPGVDFNLDLADAAGVHRILSRERTSDEWTRIRFTPNGPLAWIVTSREGTGVFSVSWGIVP